MDKLLRIFVALDWLVGGLSILVGLYLQNYWVVAGGTLGLLAAYFKPAVIIKNKMEKKFLRKKKKTEDSDVALAEDTFYAQVLGAEAAEKVVAAPAVPQAPRAYPDLLPPYAGVFLSKNRHNQVLPQHIRLLADPAESESVQKKLPPGFY
jgi:hypothetical protein